MHVLQLWHCATYLIFFTWLEVFNHHELLWNQSNPIIRPWQPFKGCVCHRCSKKTQKNVKKSTTIIFVDLAAGEMGITGDGTRCKTCENTAKTELLRYITSKYWAINTELLNKVIILSRTWTIKTITEHGTIWMSYWILILSTSILLNRATLLQGKDYTFSVL